jgi:hypothetical protein
MAGRDASANLGGMLSQIGGAFAGAGQSVGQGLMRPITMAFRPQLDPKSVESLQRQAAFQGRIGDTEQARLFTGQALALEERNRVEAERKRKLEEGQARVAAINAYGRAVASGDATAISAALEEANRVGKEQGIVMTPFIDAEDARVVRKKREQETNEDRVYTLEERERVKTDREALDALATKLLTASSIDAVNQALDGLPSSISVRATQLRDSAVNRINSRIDRERSEEALKAPLDKIDSSILPAEADIAPELRTGFNNAIAAFNKRIEQLNQDIASGKAIYPGQKQQVQQQRAALEARIYRETDGAINRKYAEEQSNDRTLQRALDRIATDNFSKQERDAVKDVPDEFFDLNDAQAIRLLRNQSYKQIYMLRGEEVPPELVQFEEGDPEYVKAGLSTEQPSAALPQSAIDDGVTEAEWSAMTPGERALYD